MKNITANMETLSIFESLKKYDIKPLKRMGQNFLIDENVLGKIIESAELSKNDTILEIGPGLGILTIELAKRVKRVIAIEKDKILCQALKKILEDQRINNVELINGDILNTKYKIQATSYKLIANLPYYITSPVIRKFLEAGNKPASTRGGEPTRGGPSLMILMVQKEVAERICAKPPKMSILSVAVQFYAEPEIIDYVSKNCFYPQPKVDSAIIKIVPKQIPKINTEKFFALVRAGFSAKRKMLKNNLSTLLEANQLNLEKLGLNPKVRAENLSINDWLKLFHSQTLY